MKTELPTVARVVVLSPHPDDEVLGCGGTISLLAHGGSSVTTVFATDGERLLGEPSAEVADIRRSEAKKASQVLGCGEPVFLGFPDGCLTQHAKPLEERLNEKIRALRPDIVFCPSPVDHHADHRALSRVSLTVFNRLAAFRLAFYEVYATIRFSHLIDISDSIGLKEEALLSYRSSLYERPDVYLRAILGLNTHRSIFTQQPRYYEAFWIVDENLSEAAAGNWILYWDQGPSGVGCRARGR